MSAAERFPFAPLEHAALAGEPRHVNERGRHCPHCHRDRLNHAVSAVCVTTEQVAERLGVTDRTVYRWRHTGLTADAADQLAVRLGHHPAEIWPAAWKAVAA